jgi:hypothetical protein
MEGIKMKTCTECGLEKELSEFSKEQCRGMDTLYIVNRCSESDKEFYSANKKHRLKTAKQYRETHSDDIKQYQKQWYLRRLAPPVSN